jgi:membrane protein
MVLQRMTRRQWTALAKTVKTRMDDHNLTLVAAGVAFYAFLALIPALIAVVSLYGLVANPSDVTRQVNDFSGALPHEARVFMTSQLHSIIASSSASVTLALVIGIAAAVWSASAAMVSLVRGIDLAQGRRERRTFVAQRGLALALTAAAASLVIVVVLLVASAPPLLASAGVGDIGRWVLNVARWPLVALIMVVALAALYHFVGGRSGLPQVGWGPVIGAAVWLLASALFALYTANFSNYSKTYGTLASIVVALLWLWLGALAALIGAEVDTQAGSQRH